MDTTTPSPYCMPHMSRKQAEELLGLLRSQQMKKWAPHIKSLLRALRENANGKAYED